MLISYKFQIYFPVNKTLEIHKNSNVKNIIKKTCCFIWSEAKFSYIYFSKHTLDLSTKKTRKRSVNRIIKTQPY